MKIVGVDFTSAPSNKKKISAAEGRLESKVLYVSNRRDFATQEQFVGLLNEPGPWIAAIDFPFGLPARLVQESRWRDSWSGYVNDCVAMGKEHFVEYMRNYQHSVTGERRLLRETDQLAGSRSPMQVDFIPIGKMFFVGAPILAESACTLVPFRIGHADAGIVVEGYPKLVAMKAVQRNPYKSERPTTRRPAEARARQRILNWLSSDEIRKHYGFTVELADPVANDCKSDARGDSLDAVLCAVQAAWAWTKRRDRYGVPHLERNLEELEGWIIDPHTLQQYDK